MVFEIILLALIIGKLRGGEIRKLENLYIRGWYLIALSFFVEMISLFLVTRIDVELSTIVETNFFYIHIFIYALLLAGVVMNFKEKGFRIVFFGAILNFLPIALNNGKMPVSINALKNADLYNQLNLLSDDRIMTHTLSLENTKFFFLGDIIPIPKPYPFPKIISIGDILISIGLFIVIYTYMTKRTSIKYLNNFKP